MLETFFDEAFRYSQSTDSFDTSDRFDWSIKFINLVWSNNTAKRNVDVIFKAMFSR